MTAGRTQSADRSAPTIVDLGFASYRDAYAEQLRRVEAALAARDAGSGVPGTVLLVEHRPVITISRRPDARKHLLASDQVLSREGIEVVETDRGGDITYHGPGQLVAYPILDLNWHGLNLHAYMRLLEQAVIDTCEQFGVRTRREPGATGVWIDGPGEDGSAAKVCAMGVRVRRWVSMHGLALNVTTNLSHFGLIVPCGLVGRGVTSLEAQLGAACPSMAEVKATLGDRLTVRLSEARVRHLAASGGSDATRA